MYPNELNWLCTVEWKATRKSLKILFKLLRLQFCFFKNQKTFLASNISNVVYLSNFSIHSLLSQNLISVIVIHEIIGVRLSGKARQLLSWPRQIERSRRRSERVRSTFINLSIFDILIISIFFVFILQSECVYLKFRIYFQTERRKNREKWLRGTIGRGGSVVAANTPEFTLEREKLAEKLRQSKGTRENRER